MKRILVGNDFSPEADEALRTAAAFARGKGAALRVVHVVPPRRWLAGALGVNARTVSAIHSHAITAVKERADRVDPERLLEVSTGVVSGAASVELVRSVRDFDADLLAVGARGEHEAGTGGVALGGTALKLLGTSPVPLLLVRAAAAALPASVLALVDLSPLSREVLLAARSCLAPEGRLVAFHAYEAPFAARLEAYGLARDAVGVYVDAAEQRRAQELESLVASLGADPGVQLVTSRGDPVDGVLRQIETLGPELVVIGRRSGGRRRARADAGSVSSRVALLSPANLLVVPAGARTDVASEEKTP